MIISGSTAVVGVIGHPVSHSASPAMHNAAYAELGLDFAYMAFDVEPDRVGAAVESVRALGLRGINVTVPHKETVMAYLDDIDPVAKQMGAVNTIVNKKGRLVGYNTDGPGFVMAVESDFDISLSGQAVVVLGAGGSCRGIAVSLLAAGVSSLTIVNRSLDKAKALGDSLNSESVQVYTYDDADVVDVLHKAGLVVNTTSVGMSPNTDYSVLKDFSWVRDGQCVYDVIYAPKKTQFLALAEAKGARVANGVSMLAAQGRLAFAYFTGVECSFEGMKSEIEKGLL